MTEDDRGSRREGSSDRPPKGLPGAGPRTGDEGPGGVAGRADGEAGPTSRPAGSNGELSARLRRIAGSYHAPPPTPREEIWTAVEERLITGPGSLARRSRRRRERADRTAGHLAWTGRIAAAVALVAMGFGAGRLSFGADGAFVGEAASGASAVTTTTAEAEGVSSAVEGQALDYLTRSGTLLASVRADAREGVAGPGVGLWGRGLLQETRVILDSPVAHDPAMRALLEDLELVLAQVAVLSDRERVGEARGREELRLIARGLDRRELLPRIHAILPSGTDLRTEEGDR